MRRSCSLKSNELDDLLYQLGISFDRPRTRCFLSILELENLVYFDNLQKPGKRREERTTRRHLPYLSQSPSVKAPSFLILILSLPLEPRRKPLKPLQNVRTNPRIRPNKRRPAKQTAPKTARPYPSLRTSNRDPNPLQRSLKGHQNPRPLQEKDQCLSASPTGDSRQRPRLICRCGVWGVSCLQSESEEGV